MNATKLVSIEQRTSARCNMLIRPVLMRIPGGLNRAAHFRALQLSRSSHHFIDDLLCLNRAAHFRALQRGEMPDLWQECTCVSIEQRTSARCNRRTPGRSHFEFDFVSIEQRTSARCNLPRGP